MATLFLRRSLWIQLALKFIFIVSLFTFLLVNGTQLMPNSPVFTSLMLNSTNEPPTSEKSVSADIMEFILGFNSDHGVLVFVGIIAYICVETCALLLCIHAIVNNCPHGLRPEIVLNIAFASMQISAVIIFITTVAMFGLEWLVQMMVNAKRARGLDLSADYIDLIRHRMPAVCALYIVHLINGAVGSLFSAMVLDAYKRYFGTKIATGADLGGFEAGDGGDAQAARLRLIYVVRGNEKSVFASSKEEMESMINDNVLTRKLCVGVS